MVFWKPAPSGGADVDSLCLYLVLVSDIPQLWNQENKKAVSIVPLGSGMPQPERLTEFVEAGDDLTALNWAKATLLKLPGLKEHRVQISQESR